MTQLPQTTCPHCGALNPAGSAFCESCGKALPAGAVGGGGGPRLVTGDALAATSAGAKLQSDDLQRQAKKASGALLAVAIIQTIATIILGFVLNRIRSGQGPMVLNTGAVVGLAVIAVLFWGLYFWSRRQPLPAAIVGLVVYLTLVAINVVTTIAAQANAPSGSVRPGGIGIGCIDIIIIAVLAQAITAGLKYRRLQQQGAVGGFPVMTQPPAPPPPPGTFR